MVRPILMLLFPALACAADCSPGAAERQRILATITGNARSYAQALPNFLATRVTRRFLDPSGSGHGWHMVDTVEQQLSYFDYKETYTLVSVDGQPAKSGAAPGLSTGGEFGAVFEDIFSPQTEAAFQWKRCESIHGIKMYVFEYRETKARETVGFSLTQPEPNPRLLQENVNRQTQASVPYHGLIYADRQTGKVMRLTIISEVARNFPMQHPERQLDYAWTLVAGGEFLLPQKVTVRAQLHGTLMRNETEFLLYRKFEANSVLKFEKR